MALPKETGEAAAVELERFCNQRSPEDARSQIRLEYEVKGSTITIVERRAPWNEESGSDWSRQPIAQLRFDGRAKRRPGRCTGRATPGVGTATTTSPPRRRSVRCSPRSTLIPTVFWG